MFDENNENNENEIDGLKNQLFGFLQDIKGMCVVSSYFLETKDLIKTKTCTEWLRYIDSDTLKEIISFFKYAEEAAHNISDEELSNIDLDKLSIDSVKVDEFNKMIHNKNINKDNFLDVAEDKLFNSEPFSEPKEYIDDPKEEIKKTLSDRTLDISAKYFDSYNLIEMILAWEMGSVFQDWDSFLLCKKVIDFSQFFKANYFYVQNLVILAKQELYRRDRDPSIFFNQNYTLDEIDTIIKNSDIEKSPSLCMIHNFPLFTFLLNNYSNFGLKEHEGISKVEQDIVFSKKCSFYAEKDKEIIILNIDFTKPLLEQFSASVYDIDSDEVNFSFSSPYLKQILDWISKYLEKDVEIDTVEIMQKSLYLKSILF